MADEIILIVTEPDLIRLINEVSMREKPICELKKKIGIRAYYKSITRSKYCMMKIKEDFRKYNEDPIREEIEFFKSFLRKSNGRKIQHIQLSNDIIFEKVSDTTMFLKVRVGKNKAVLGADYFPAVE